jgi:transcriptional regulator with GAF, ATPase, and Fis domain
MATAGLVLIAAPTVGPLRRRLERGVEALLFPAQRRARELIAQAARERALLRTPGELVAFLRRALGDAFGCERIRLLAGAPDAALAEAGAEPSPLALAPADPLYVAVRRGRQVLAGDPAPGGRAGPSRAAVQRLATLGAALAVPLPASSERIGMLLLSARRDGRPYTREDAALVATLAGQVAVALDDARALEALEELQRRLSAENLYLREEAGLVPGPGELVGDSPALRELRERIEKVAPTDATVLIEGETGTGKELVAHAIHRQSRRAERPFVQVACAALPEPLLESELFGHERGAFTGAAARKLGRFEVADGGTLFLDDVDLLGAGVQAKLLRALQEGEVQRLGSLAVRHVDVRVVAASNRDLLAEVRAGRFREDLYYRLAVVPIRVPPLRERREDIPLLVEHFVRQEAQRLGRTIRAVSADTLAALAAHDWPGNVRELRNAVARAVVMSGDGELRLEAPLAPAAGAAAPCDVEAAARADLGRASLAELVQRYKEQLVRGALARCDGNQTRAAELLGVHRPNLSRLLRELDRAAGAGSG